MKNSYSIGRRGGELVVVLHSPDERTVDEVRHALRVMGHLTPRPANVGALTRRETQVMRLLVAGMSNKGIARALSVSPRTIDVHRARVMSKVQATSVVQLARIALEQGWVALDDVGSCPTQTQAELDRSDDWIEFALAS